MGDNKTQANIEYSKRKWSGYLRVLGKYLYTERIHYFYLYKYLKNLPLTEDFVLLDIGFGSGYNIKKITKKFNINTIGADIVPETVDKYNNLKIQNSSAILIDAKTSKIPLKDGSVDIIVCSHILEHVPDDRVLLKEVFRLLKNNGIAYFNIPINEEKINVPLHIRKYKKNNFIELLQQHHFKILKTIESDIFTQIISYLGVNKNFFNNIIKKSLIFILSCLPLGLLEKIPGKKSQFICIAKKENQ